MSLFMSLVMKRAWLLTLMVLILFSGLGLYAQEETDPEENPDDEPDYEWVDIVTAPFSKGDRNFIISLGIIFPTFFVGLEEDHGISLGGTGSLAFNYFITEKIFVGAELAGMFAGTRAGNMLYVIPFGVRIGYQFWYRRFEFPVSIMIGAAPQRYLDKGYFGPIAKGSASAFWRFNPEWSFGLNGVWWLIPQWPKNGNNAIGNFMELTLSARHHF